MNRLANALRFHLEQWLQRGVLHQLLFVAVLVGLVSVAGGLVAWAATDQFEGPFAAIWWAFLRLSDPGYLGDDEGTLLRVISTVVTVLGYVLFMGSMIAIMTQWLARTLRQLESGLAPISMRGHAVILGWTVQTPEIVGQLLSARGRLRRFLEARQLRSLKIVIVADEVSAERRYRLRTELGKHWRSRQIFLRAGDPLEPADLLRLDLRRASAIVVPGDEFAFGSARSSDTRALKTLLNLGPILDPVPADRRPVVVAEMFDPRTAGAVLGTIADSLEVVPGDAVVARLVAQTIRDSRLATVFLELVSHHRGCAPYLRSFPEFAGRHPVELNGHFDRAVVIGATRRREGRAVTYLNPPADFKLERDDMLVLIARSHDDCAITNRDVRAVARADARLPALTRKRAQRRALILGWSHKLGVILEELGRSADADFEVTMVSRIAIPKREIALRDFDWNPDRLRIELLERDHTAPHVLAELGVTSFDSVVFLASTWTESPQEADARAILGYGLLKALLATELADGDSGPEILVEFVDPASRTLFAESRDVMLVAPRLLGYLQSHVALLPSLNSVFGELFAPGGAELAIRNAADYQLEGEAIAWREVERSAVARGDIALGTLKACRTEQDPLELCPPPDRSWSPAGDELIVVLAASR